MSDPEELEVQMCRVCSGNGWNRGTREALVECAGCNGTGVKPVADCPMCHGQKFVHPVTGVEILCNLCQGDIMTKPCNECVDDQSGESLGILETVVNKRIRCAECNGEGLRGYSTVAGNYGSPA